MNTSIGNMLQRLWVALLFCATSLWASQGWAVSPAACVPNTSGWGTPTLDGVVENMNIPSTSASYIGDQGWNEAYRFNLYRQDHPAGYALGDLAAAHIKLSKSDYDPMTKQGTLWIGIWVDALPDAYNTVILGIAGASGVPGVPGDIWRLHLSPFCNGTCGVSHVNGEYIDLGSPTELKVSNKYPAIQVWHDTSISNVNSATSMASSWANLNTVRLARDTNRWSLELKVPYTTQQSSATAQRIYLPAGGEFKMYFDILSTHESGIGAFVNQRPWPQSSPLGISNGFGEIEKNTPDLGNWGIVSLDGSFTTPANASGTKVSCAGVEINVGDFGVRNNLPTNNNGHQMAAISGPFFNNGTPITTVAGCSQLPDTPVGNLNTFFAKPKNMSSTIAASGVSATFYVADWGISNNWSRIGTLAPPSNSPGGSNASATSSVNLAINGGQSEVSATWALTPKQSCMYLLSNVIGTNKSHHCVQVVLNSADPATSFSKVSSTDNFDFVGMSTFERPVVLSTKNMGPVPAGRTMHQMILESRREAIDYTRDGKKYYANQATGYVPSDLRAVSAERFPGPITSAYLWTVDGHILNGHTLRINGKPFEDTNYAGAFGYLGGHNGPVSGFDANLSGSAVRALENGMQVAQIPADSDLLISSRMEAKEITLAPPCPCGTMCPKVGTTLPASDNKLAGTEFLWVGIAGVGAAAYVRRRRNKSNKQ